MEDYDMEKGKWRTVRNLVPLFLLITHTVAYGQFAPASNIDTLKEIKGIYFTVTWQGSEKDQEDFSIGQIEKEVIRRLKQTGVNILPEKEFHRLSRTQRYPLARLDLVILPMEVQEKEIKIYYISLQAVQLVQLLRKPIIKIWAPTWEERAITSGSEQEDIIKTSMDLLERFIHDYRTVNQ
jgi:hypothetical protein